METLIQPLRYVHISGGALVLIIGLLQMLLPKRGLRHRVLGQAYTWLMIIVSLSAIIVSTYRIISTDHRGSVFLLVVGLFSLYLVVSGYRLGHLKNQPAHTFDKLWTIVGTLFGVLLLSVSFWMFSLNNTVIAIIALVFGIIQSWSAIEDYGYFIQGKRKKKYGSMTWHFTHLGRMIGSYIAATTAFLVNAVDAGPPILKWLGPTVAGAIVIAAFSRHYSKKFGFSKSVKS